MLRRYKKRSHISDAKIRGILRCFSLDLNASKTSKIVKVSRVTINNYFLRFRKIIFFSCEKFFPESGVFELDESYFGAKRIRGKIVSIRSRKNASFWCFNLM